MQYIYIYIEHKRNIGELVKTINIKKGPAIRHHSLIYIFSKVAQ